MPETTTTAPTPPKLKPGHKANLSTIERAAANDDLGIVSAIRKSDGKAVCLVCAESKDGDGRICITPLAEMVDGNPFELYHDPTV